MACVTPLRLALGLAGCPEADQPALATEAGRARLDFVTLGRDGVEAALAAAPRVGVLTSHPDDDRRLVLAGAGDVTGFVVTRADDVALAAEHADVAFVTPADPASTPDLVDDLRTARAASPQADQRLLVFADVRLADLPAGSASGLASYLQNWQRRGLDGFRVIAGSAAEVHALTRGVVPALLENDAFRRGYDATTLRGVLGLPTLSRR